MDPAPYDQSKQSAKESAVVAHSSKACEFFCHGVKRPENEPWFFPVKSACVIDQSGKNSGSKKKENDSEGYEAEYVVFRSLFVQGIECTFPELFLQYDEGSGKGDDVHEAIPAYESKQWNSRKNLRFDPGRIVDVKKIAHFIIQIKIYKN